MQRRFSRTPPPCCPKTARGSTLQISTSPSPGRDRLDRGWRNAPRGLFARLPINSRRTGGASRRVVQTAPAHATRRLTPPVHQDRDTSLQPALNLFTVPAATRTSHLAPHSPPLILPLRTLLPKNEPDITPSLQPA